MKILLVDNHTRHIEALSSNLRDHEVEILKYEPGVEFNTKDKDIVILSGGGGEGYEIHDKHKGDLWYKDELAFIRDCQIPMLGICMGFELIAHAYGSPIERIDPGVQQFVDFELVDGRPVRQFESHDFAVKKVSNEHFEVKAKSSTGIEMIKHHRKPMLGVQFHPELGGSLKLPDLIKLATS